MALTHQRFISYQEYVKDLWLLVSQVVVVSTALWCFSRPLLWDQEVGVTLGVMHRKLQTRMQVRWKSQATGTQATQNWIQLAEFCGRDGGGGTELKTHRNPTLVILSVLSNQSKSIIYIYFTVRRFSNDLKHDGCDVKVTDRLVKNNLWATTVAEGGKTIYYLLDKLI